MKSEDVLEFFKVLLIAAPLLICALMITKANAGSTCIDLGGGMQSCHGDDGSTATGINLGSGMTTWSGTTPTRQPNAFGGHTQQPWSTTCIRLGNIVNCN